MCYVLILCAFVSQSFLTEQKKIQTLIRVILELGWRIHYIRMGSAVLASIHTLDVRVNPLNPNRSVYYFLLRKRIRPTGRYPWGKIWQKCASFFSQEYMQLEVSVYPTLLIDRIYRALGDPPESVSQRASLLSPSLIDSTVRSSPISTFFLRSS